MLALDASARSAVLRWCEQGYPHEACGLLLGDAGPDLRRVRRAFAARNLETISPGTRFVLAPQDFLAADDLARAEGVHIVGTWHSHPDRAAEPSALDREAAQPSWSHVIVEVRGDGSRGRARAPRSWHVRGGVLCEEALALGACENPPWP